MTPEQRRALITACDDGDDVRIVTLALQIGAHAARNDRAAEAIAIRRVVDAHQNQEHARAKYLCDRLDLAKRIYACNQDKGLLSAVGCADALLRLVASTPIPGMPS